MDLHAVDRYRRPATRDELFPLAGDEVVLGGGSWLFGEPAPPGVAALVDLRTLGWPALTTTDDGLSVAGTCTIAELAAWPRPAGWPATALFVPCSRALLGSFKVHHVATVGGNIAMGLPAGPMIALGSALEATAVLWRSGGGERRVPVAELVVGPRLTRLEPSEVLRSVEIPAVTLRSTTASRQISLSPRGRTGSLVIGRRDADDRLTVTVTGATPRPVVLRFAGWPAPDDVQGAVAGIEEWYDDVHGRPDWRRAVTQRLAAEVLAELADGGRTR